MSRRGPRREFVLAGVLLTLVAASAFATRARGKDGPIAVPPPDLAFFAQKVDPFLREVCGECHAAGAGGFAFGDGRPDARGRSGTTRAFAAVRPYVDAEAPWASRLILKALSEEEGGLPHGGGALLRTSDAAYDDLLDFASGATPTNLPPIPEPGADRRIPLGDAVELDGSLSFDRDSDPLVFRWELRARPPGSKAALVGASGPRSRVEADVPGTYVVALRVFDGKAWSAAKPVVLECLERTGPSVPDAVASSGLDGVAPDVLRRVRAVYGDVLARPPTPPEILSVRDREPTALAEVLLATFEAGRAFVEDTAWRLALTGDAEPHSDDVGDLPARFVAGTVSPAAAEAVLVRDPAFLRAHPAGDALARAVAELLLERDPSPDEKGAWGTPAALAAVLRSDEFAAAALRRWARRFGVGAGAASLAPARATESAVALARAFVASPDYALRSATRRRAEDTAFVRALFADLLGRRPTSKELSALASAAAVLPGSSAGRAAVVDVVLDSGEAPLPLIADLKDPDAWLADRFLRYVGRRPSAPEAGLFRAALMDPDGGPHVVIRALLTGAEYASR